VPRFGAGPAEAHRRGFALRPVPRREPAHQLGKEVKTPMGKRDVEVIGIVVVGRWPTHQQSPTGQAAVRVETAVGAVAKGGLDGLTPGDHAQLPGNPEPRSQRRWTSTRRPKASATAGSSNSGAGGAGGATEAAGGVGRSTQWASPISAWKPWVWRYSSSACCRSVSCARSRPGTAWRPPPPPAPRRRRLRGRRGRPRRWRPEPRRRDRHRGRSGPASRRESR
jgi:hypothetical protein